MNDKLTSLLTGEEPRIETPEAVAVEPARTGLYAGIINFFYGKSTSSPPAPIENRFNPTFNIREEFAIWMRQEFPDFIGGHWNKKRTKEIYEAARMACKHGEETAQTCVQIHFKMHDRYIRNKYYLSFVHSRLFRNEVNSLLKFINQLAPNLTKPENVHYGTRYINTNQRVNPRRRYFDGW